MAETPGVYIKSLVKPYGEPGIRLWVSSLGEEKDDVEARVTEAVDLLVELTRERLPNG
jgi:hypothetical protein